MTRKTAHYSRSVLSDKSRRIPSPDLGDFSLFLGVNEPKNRAGRDCIFSMIDSLRNALLNDSYELVREPRTLGDGFAETNILEMSDNPKEIS